MPDAACAAVALHDAGHWYERERWVFKGLHLSVKRGHTLCILGPNGRGKTTLLRALAGLLELRSGRVAIDGTVAYVPQLYQTVFAYSVREMVVMGRARRVGFFGRPGRNDYAAAEATLARVGLADFSSRIFNDLSGGERQLVLLARALAAESDVLVLDEPSSALDLRNQSLLLNLIADLAVERSIAVIYSSHHPQHALAANCDVLLMLDVQQHLQGPAGKILDENNLAALYGVPVRRVEVQDGNGCHAGLVPLFFTP